MTIFSVRVEGYLLKGGDSMNLKMSKTLEEAPNMWCPQNKFQCLGNKCMMWRWEKTPAMVDPERGFCGFHTGNPDEN